MLFLHRNFPAQFGNLSRSMSGQGHDVTFGTRRQGTPPEWLRTVRYQPHREVGKQRHPCLAFVESAVLDGQVPARVGWRMKAQGYSPDLVMAHSGREPGFYVRDLWPDAKYVVYFEWYDQPKGSDVGFLGDASRDDEHRIGTRNAAIGVEGAVRHSRPTGAGLASGAGAGRRGSAALRGRPQPARRSLTGVPCQPASRSLQ